MVSVPLRTLLMIVVDDRSASAELGTAFLVGVP